MTETFALPIGFKFAGLHCGLKKDPQKPDIGMMVSERPAVAAITTPKNKVVGEPVKVDRKHAKSETHRAIVVNSRISNACTGKQGYRDAIKMCSLLARAIGCNTSQVFVCSTGVIGRPLDMGKIEPGIARLMGGEGRGFELFSRAILTTDLVLKTSSRTIKLKSAPATIAGCAKGSGMISPNMATMLAFIATDAAISKKPLQEMLSRCVASTFNSITVDGHESCSDTCIVLANGMAKNAPITRGSVDAKRFETALMDVCLDLATAIVKDGEGAKKIFQVMVTGAKNVMDAEKAARAVANSPLVKTAVHGADPNWGRIMTAVGYCGADFDPEKASLKLEGMLLFRKGEPASFDAKVASDLMRRETMTFTVDLGAGKAQGVCYGCDLSKEYVSINADYTT